MSQIEPNGDQIPFAIVFLDPNSWLCHQWPIGTQIGVDIRIRLKSEKSTLFPTRIYPCPYPPSFTLSASLPQLRISTSTRSACGVLTETNIATILDHILLRRVPRSSCHLGKPTETAVGQGRGFSHKILLRTTNAIYFTFNPKPKPIPNLNVALQSTLP